MLIGNRLEASEYSSLLAITGFAALSKEIIKSRTGLGAGEPKWGDRPIPLRYRRLAMKFPPNHPSYFREIWRLLALLY